MIPWKDLKEYRPPKHGGWWGLWWSIRYVHHRINDYILFPFKQWAQKVIWGYSDVEIWNLDGGIAKYAYPKIEKHRRNLSGYPHGLTEDKWDQILAKISFALKM